MSSFSFNNSIYQSEFPSIIKLPDTLLPLRKETEVLKRIINQSAHFQTSQKLLNEACFVKLSVLGIPILQSNNLGVRKRYKIQCCLLVMLEKWKNAVDKGKYFGGSISETLFLTNCYSKITSLSFRFIGTKTYSRLPFKQKIRTKINSRYSSREEILFGVLQGYIFGTFLFNIFLCD